jgi:hypothetical protein
MRSLVIDGHLKHTGHGFTLRPLGTQRGRLQVIEPIAG